MFIVQRERTSPIESTLLMRSGGPAGSGGRTAPCRFRTALPPDNFRKPASWEIRSSEEMKAHPGHFATYEIRTIAVGGVTTVDARLTVGEFIAADPRKME